MRIFNSQDEYGLLAKLFHWVTFIVLIAQVPFGFYLVGLEFSDERIELENIHILVGITVFYLTLFRLIWKFFNPSPSETRSFFKGQVFIGKANHFLLYLSIFTITISGILKKLYMGETLNFIFFKYGFEKDNFVLADEINRAPAGGVVGAVLTVLAIIAILDLIGVTDVYPFIRPVNS